MRGNEKIVEESRIANGGSMGTAHGAKTNLPLFHGERGDVGDRVKKKKKGEGEIDKNYSDRCPVVHLDRGKKPGRVKKKRVKRRLHHRRQCGQPKNLRGRLTHRRPVGPLEKCRGGHVCGGNKGGCSKQTTCRPGIVFISREREGGAKVATVEDPHLKGDWTRITILVVEKKVAGKSQRHTHTGTEETNASERGPGRVAKTLAA